MAEMVDVEHAWCADVGCVCHRPLARQMVTTPFPVGYGPPYCCSRCARTEIVQHPVETCDRCGQSVAGQRVMINAMQSVQRHVLCPSRANV